MEERDENSDKKKKTVVSLSPNEPVTSSSSKK